MTAFALYYETRRSIHAADNGLFRKVNVFTLPALFNALPCTLTHNGKRREAQWIMRGVWWASFFSFIKGPAGEQARKERAAMASFIAERMENPCVQPAILTWWVEADIPDAVSIDGEGTRISIHCFDDIFRNPKGLYLIEG